MGYIHTKDRDAVAARVLDNNESVRAVAKELGYTESSVESATKITEGKRKLADMLAKDKDMEITSKVSKGLKLSDPICRKLKVEIEHAHKIALKKHAKSLGSSDDSEDSEQHSFSLTMPNDVNQKLSKLAEREGVSKKDVVISMILQAHAGTSGLCKTQPAIIGDEPMMSARAHAASIVELLKNIHS